MAKTVVFLAGLIPFLNRETRQEVYFVKSEDTRFHRKKTRISKLADRVRKYAVIRNVVRNYGGADRIIVFDSFATSRFLHCIQGHFYKSQRILYLRNHVQSDAKKELISVAEECGFEIWSYNKSDCEQLGFHYNPQVLDRSLFKDMKQEPPVYSALFIGNEKGRAQEIEMLRQSLKDMKLPAYFYVHDYDRTKTGKGGLEEKLIPYEEYLKLVAKSEAILDIVNEDNWGLSIRPLEALYAGKKLITNYTDIVTYPFYRKENIFLYTEENMHEIPEWLSIPFQPVPEEIISYYDIDAWLKRFENANEIK